MLAPPCASCHELLDAPTAGPICPRCWGSIAFNGPRLPPSSVVRDGCAAALFDGAMRDVIHAFKYEGRRSLAEPLARQMRVVLADILFDADYVVPVPLHPWRRLTRGFNQARDLASRLGVPMLDALWRPHFTHQQMGLTAARRRRNLGHAFRLSPLLRVTLDGRVLVLVDDVRTTGATLDACARVLLDAGAKEVRGVAAAYAR